MKATLLLGTILLMSLVMANDQGNSSPENKGKLENKGKTEDKGQSSSEGKPVESGSKPNGTRSSAGLMVSEVFFLLPFMWMVVHLLHM